MISPISDRTGLNLPDRSSAVPAAREVAGWSVYHFESVGSTNDEARRLGMDGARHRSIVVADEQASGRGRWGRSWSSPPGNFYGSALLRPDIPPPNVGELTFVASLALRAALLDIGVTDARLKWPNDVLVGGKKISGLLLESELTADGRTAFAIVGTGVNLNSFPQDVLYPATSVVASTARTVTPCEFLAAYLSTLDGWVDRWTTLGFGAVRAAWLDAAYGIGGPVEARTHAETVSGVFEGLDDQGGLILREDGGGHRIVAAGDIFPGRR